MLKSAVIIMTVMGCSDDASQCEFIEQPDIQWESAEACEAATTDALRRQDDANYPVVVAHCTTQEALEGKVTEIAKTSDTIKPSTTDNQQPESLFDQAGVPIGVIDQPVENKRILVRVKDGVVSIRKGANNALRNFVDNTRNGLTNLAQGIGKFIAPNKD